MMKPRLAALARLLVAGLLLALSAGAAGISYADNDDNRRKSSEEIELERSAQEDRQFAGQVLEINTLKDPPEMKVASIDGPPMTVLVIKRDEIARNGIRLGDHISGFGEKIHEYLFEATELRVDGHLGDNDNGD